jgi:hypothetical protein
VIHISKPATAIVERLIRDTGFPMRHVQWMLLEDGQERDGQRQEPFHEAVFT